ncbi:hypothetical protein KKF63_10335 [bacterium]|nr:hypothetical protein [bacterium]
MMNQKYLGNHTTISYLKPEQWQHIPYLKDNNGALPPFVIAVGDGRRLNLACDALKLKDVVMLHEEGEKHCGPKGRSRVESLIGSYEYNNKKVPIMMVETQMGMPATEINLRETISHCAQQYNLQDATFETDAVYVIRVGTAGGLNDPSSDSYDLQIGDIVNVTFSIGWAGTLIESLAGLNYASQEVMNTFREAWIQSGYSFTNDNEYPSGKSSPTIIQAINTAAQDMKINVIEGGNFSKDSFYAEIDENLFINLRKKYDVMSTEMEQMALLKLVIDFKKMGITLNTGLVSGIIGVVPGWTFEIGEKAEQVEKNALKVAAQALWNICYQ